MANVKQDLLNKIGIDKYYAELELGRLAADPNMNYQDKINGMTYLLERLAILNGQIGLAGQYFPDQVVAPQQVNVSQPPAPAAAHPGQSHGE